MHDNLFDFACKELDELDMKAKNEKLTMPDMQYADLLEHYKKSVLANEAMSGNGEYSNHYPYWMRGAYADGNRGSYRVSYAGRRNARRDSMGRYSGERGYSRDGGMVEELRELMEDAPDERTRQEFQRFIQKLENM